MSLGDRIKKYEAVYRRQATPRMPLMVRVDGRAFHTLTRKHAKKPFDLNLMAAMVNAAQDVMCEMQGCKVAYIQSDEATFLLTDYDTHETEGWFDYDIVKVISISSALMSVYFNAYYGTAQKPVFDSRAFSVPLEDVVNAFLWRAKDWERNSIQMYARSFFSHKELHLKNREMIHEMLHKIGKNWTTDLSDWERNGAFLLKYSGRVIEQRFSILPTYESIKTAIWDIIKYPE